MTGKYEYPLTQGEPAAFEVSRKLMTYDAEHPDRMRSYGYERCEYDATGRPTVYRDHPCTWERGMLKTYSRNGIDTVYGYDAGGGRTSKTVTKQRDVVDGDGNTVKDEFGNPVTESFTVTTAYTYLGDKLIRQSDGADTLDFFYDDSGLRMINHNGTDYIVRKNIMGDVTHLYTTEGKMVGKYVYDAWGNPLRFCTSERVSQLNPILYRGYCYDPETRLYYLKTRYYDPEACRFISSDDEHILLLTADHANGIMSYTYCANNPVMMVDDTGCAPKWWQKLLMGIEIFVGTVLFVAAIVASAGAVGALAGVGAAALGLSAGTVSTIATIATIGTYVVAAGVGLFGLNDAVTSWSGTNLMQTYVFGGNETAYNITKGVFYTLGSIAVLAGTFGPKILQNIAKGGKFSREGFVRDIGRNGKWGARIDATVHGNPKIHHNPHVHFLQRSVKQGGKSVDVYYWWEIIRRFLRL